MSLGIDFGTCWSSAAVAIGGEARPVKDSHRLGYTVPSVACWDPAAAALLVGEAAEFAGRDDPAHVVREFKRDVGKGISYRLADKPFETADLIGALIRQFAAEAAGIISEGTPPGAAVLTVPAHWEGHSRDCIAGASRAAGVEPHLLAEPVAALLYHEHRTSRQVPDGEPVLVYHLGGGAFSVSLLLKRNGQFDESIPSRGSDEVGGGAFDSAIFRDLLATAPPDLRQRLEDRGEAGVRLRLALAEECRRLKHQLSRAGRGTLRPDPQRSDWAYTLDRDRFEALVRAPLDATVRLCRDLTSEAGIAADKPIRVLLTGGGTRIPLVRQVVERAFGRPPECVDDPELAVCQGAALHAARVCPDPTLGDPALAAAVRAVEAEQRKQVEEAKKKPFVFLLAGRTGVGKSSTVNSLLGKTVAPVGDYFPTTAEVKAYPVRMGPVGFNVVDTPGLCDGQLKVNEEMRYLELMSKEAPAIHSLWFVSDLSDTRLRDDESKAIKLITQAFGPGVWKHAVIVLTRADLVRPGKFAEAMKFRPEVIREEIAKHTGQREVANAIPAVGVDNFSTTTPDGRTWKGVLYATVFRRVANDGLIVFALGTEFQVRVVDAAPAAGGRVRRKGSAFRILDALPNGEEEEYEEDDAPVRGEDRVKKAPIEIDQQTASELRGRARETIVESCARTGGSMGESVGRFFGSASTGRSIGESVGRAVGKVLSWFGW